jgi:haloacetate dehalogenase
VRSHRKLTLGHQRVALVGHDIGVRVAYRYCLDHEDGVERLVLLDGAPPTERLRPQSPELIRQSWHSYFH